MQHNGTETMARGGRDASRQHRKQLVQGKLPAKAERTRSTMRVGDVTRRTPSASPVSESRVAAASAPPVVASPARPVAQQMSAGGRDASLARRKAIVQGKAALGARSRDSLPARGAPALLQASEPGMASSLARPLAQQMSAGGRDASRARRKAMVQGKAALGMASGQVAPASTPAASAAGAAATSSDQSRSAALSGRRMAEAMRAARAQTGRGSVGEAGPSGRVRDTAALSYPRKVEATKTHAAQIVTGVRIGRGSNVTGDEPGANKPISGTQYIAADGRAAYRIQAAKVGASRTVNGQIVTGTQVRSQVTITGDEFRGSVSITGEADQTLDDDLLADNRSGVATAAQFHRQNAPHGATVFGTNLGRSIRHVGSRDRGQTNPALETSLGGHPISGSAIGRSPIVTGDEPGACRPITGSQYLRAAADQPLCERDVAPALRRMGMLRTRGETETWARQRITGVELEFKPGVTGDEPGTCAAITGTPYAGPGSYERYCKAGSIEAAAARLDCAHRGRMAITGDIPLTFEGVTGSERGAGSAISGTPYSRDAAERHHDAPDLATVASGFSVNSPQRTAQLASGGAQAITGSFAIGAGKVTGNREFDHVARWQGRGRKGTPPVTGEGRVEGPHVTGSAWGPHDRVTGTEGFTAAGRNPTERAGQPHSFAGAGKFRGQGTSKAPTHEVTGMAGTDTARGLDKQKGRVTLSGGARG